MQAILLDISTGAKVPSTNPVILVQRDVRTLSENDIYPRGTINSTLTLDPCKECPLKGICPSDDCGMHLYELDEPEENYTPFSDWLYDTLCRH